MNHKLFVANFPYATTIDDLSGLFMPFGAVLDVTIARDRETGRSRGFGFVELDSEEACTSAVSGLDGTDFGGRRIAVRPAVERQRPEQGERRPRPWPRRAPQAERGYPAAGPTRRGRPDSPRPQRSFDPAGARRQAPRPSEPALTDSSSSIADVAVLEEGRVLEVHWQDDARRRFHALWLCDNRDRPKPGEPATGARPSSITEIPRDILIASASAEDGHAVQVAFDPLSVEAAFTSSWLRRHGSGRVPLAEAGLRFWDGDTLEEPPHWTHAEVEGDRDVHRNWLEAVRSTGIAVLSDVPAGPDAISRVAGLLGAAEDASHGRPFDFPANADGTPVLRTHWANRESVPGPLLLHCIAVEDESGAVALVDGFHAALALEREDPEGFAVLARSPVPFHGLDPDSAISVHAPIIELDAAGGLRGVRYDGRMIGTIEVPFERLMRFYEAYRRFVELIERPAARIELGLHAGDVLVVDNRRILSDRLAEGAAGGRFQACFGDRDALLDAIRRLDRKADAAG